MLRTYELMRDNESHCASTIRGASATSWSTSSRTRTRLQYAWLKVFCWPRDAAVFAVGDDDQSIYAFRGAQVGNMAAFEREFHVEQVIKLERNYRSFGNILDAANELISKQHQAPRQEPAHGSRAGRAGARARVDRATIAEAQWFVEEAQQLHREGTPRHDIALLYRSNAQSRVMESALFNAEHSVQGLRRACASSSAPR